MKRIIVLAMVVLAAASSVGVAQELKIDEKSAEVSRPVTHPEMAELLVRALGLARFLPNAPTPQQIFDLLMQNGIKPDGGWKLDATVTRLDLAQVVVRALRMDEMVENPQDPQSWLNALKEMGISMDRLSETVQSVEALPDGMGQNLALQSTDPLVYGMGFAPGTVQYTVDLNSAVRVLSQMEMISGEFRPAPPTPY
jgi:hypothetical protein